MLVEMVLPSGAVMLVEGHLPPGPQDVGLLPRIDAEQITTSLVDFVGMWAQAAAKVNADESEFTFTIGVEVKTGKLVAYLGEGTAEGSATVRLLWKRPA